MTQQDLNEIKQMMIDSSIDYSEKLSITGWTEADWQKILILALDIRNGQKGGNLQLKDVLDHYGGDIRSLKAELLPLASQAQTAAQEAKEARDAALRAKQESIDAVKEQERLSKAAVEAQGTATAQTASAAVNQTKDAALASITEKQTQVEGAIQDAVDHGIYDVVDQTTVIKNEVNTLAGQAKDSEKAAAGSLTSTQALMTEMNALYAQMQTVASQTATPTVMIEGVLYSVAVEQKLGRTYRRYTKIE